MLLYLQDNTSVKMKDRIKKLIEKEHLNYSEFADKIGIQKSVISHLVNGRNKPSLEVIQKMLEAFEYLNPDWLILGKGNMLREVKQAQLRFLEEEKEAEKIEIPKNEELSNSEKQAPEEVTEDITQEPPEKEQNSPPEVPKKLKQIVFFYEGENTFKIYNSEE